MTTIPSGIGLNKGVASFCMEVLPRDEISDPTLTLKSEGPDGMTFLTITRSQWPFVLENDQVFVDIIITRLGVGAEEPSPATPMGGIN